MTGLLDSLPIVVVDNYNFDSTRNPGIYVSTDPVGLDAGTYHVVVMEGKRPNNSRYTVQVFIDIDTQKIFVRTGKVTGFSSFIELGAGSGGAGGGVEEEDFLTLISRVDDLESDLATETTNRTNADTALSSDISDVAADLATETTNRTNADTALSSELNILRTDVEAGTYSTRRNLLINGDFQINQRASLPSGAFTGGALSAGQFGYDRWKADTGGANVTLSGYVVTLTSGTLVQIVEPSLISGFSSLASTDVTVSMENPSDDMLVSFGSQSGVISAGSGRQAVTLTMDAGDTGNLSFKIAKDSGTGSCTFSRVKLETGSNATRWESNVDAVEKALAWRYFQHTPGPIAAPALADSFASRDVFIGFRAPMRTVPSMDFLFVDAGDVAIGSTGGSYGGTTVGINVWRDLGSTTQGAYLRYWTANAEL